MKNIYLDYNEIEKACQSIARAVELDNWRPDYIVGLSRGGLLPATLLSHYLEVPMYTLDVSFRDNNSDMGPESNAWMAEDALSHKQILIVDDINDTGATLKWIVDDWHTSCRPASGEWDDVFGGNVRVATVVNNESSEFGQISYYGKEINKADEDVWVVFPWEEWWTAKPE